jgi:4-aminobutyrate aminotransferase
MLSVKKDQLNGQSDEHWIGPAPWIETPPPGPNAKLLISRDRQWSSPSYGRYYPLVARRASGSVVEDVDGNRFLDFAAGIAVCSTGHCHPKVVEAIKKQAGNLIHACGSIFYYPPMVELMEKLAAIIPGKEEKRVFLANSGTEATEGAIKLARYHTRRPWIISFHGAFHGRTTGALAITCSKAVQQAGFGPLLPAVAHVPHGDVEAIEHLFACKMAPTDVAAIFVEVIQGEGGYQVPETEFLPRLRSLCDKHGILLVCDEIQSGMGRTGKWFAFEHFGIVPDIILIAKGIASGMPLGAIVARSEVCTWKPGSHASTFGGNPVCCAAALATIELIEGGLMANAAKLGERMRLKLHEIASRRKCVENVRGLGLMNAVDVVSARTGKASPQLRKRVLEEAFSRGLLLLGCGESSIRICPPLCLNETQLDVGLQLLDEVVATVQ